jgi:hypothetical protein
MFAKETSKNESKTLVQILGKSGGVLGLRSGAWHSDIYPLEIRWNSWRAIFYWFFLGKMDSGSVISKLPVEIIYSAIRFYINRESAW